MLIDLFGNKYGCEKCSLAVRFRSIHPIITVSVFTVPVIMRAAYVRWTAFFRLRINWISRRAHKFVIGEQTRCLYFRVQYSTNFFWIVTGDTLFWPSKRSPTLFYSGKRIQLFYILEILVGKRQWMSYEIMHKSYAANWTHTIYRGKIRMW